MKTPPIKMLRWSLPSLLALLLISCGFHLRGTQSASIDLTAISFEFSHQDHKFETNLKQAAANDNIAVTPDADWLIQIINIDTEKLRITSSVTSERDRFSLYYRVTYNLVKQHEDHQDTFGPILVEKQAIFQDDERKVVSKYNEETRIFDELSIKAADALLRRTALIASNPPHCKAQDENQGAAAQ